MTADNESCSSCPMSNDLLREFLSAARRSLSSRKIEDTIAHIIGEADRLDDCIHIKLQVSGTETLLVPSTLPADLHDHLSRSFIGTHLRLCILLHLDSSSSDRDNGLGKPALSQLCASSLASTLRGTRFIQHSDYYY